MAHDDRRAVEPRDDPGVAVVNALARTGRLVTSAAVILCISFASITLTPNVDIKVLAFGLAAGILLDATVTDGTLELVDARHRRPRPPGRHPSANQCRKSNRLRVGAIARART